MIEPKITLRFEDQVKRPGSMRFIGRAIREFVKDLWKKYDVVELDFENETVASGSLFDEIAKLFLEYPKEEVKRRLRFINIDPWDERLIVHLAKLRMERSKNLIVNGHSG